MNIGEAGDGFTCVICGTYVIHNTMHNCPGYKISALPVNGELYINPCEHCYCLNGKGNCGTSPHRKCCHCGHELAEEFIFGDE